MAGPDVATEVQATRHRPAPTGCRRQSRPRSAKGSPAALVADHHAAKGPQPRPRIGLTLDAEPPGGYSKLPWYAIRANYCRAIARAGGLPLALPHEVELAEAYLDLLDGLVVTGGAFDVDPALYGDAERHPTVRTKDQRTAFEFAITRAALARDLPVLGICGGQQLLNVVLGGDLDPAHPGRGARTRVAHEQPNPRTEPGHEVEVVPGSGCTRSRARLGSRSTAPTIRRPARVGAGVVVSGRAPDGVIEAIEAPGTALLPRRPVASGIRHLGRRRRSVRRPDRGLPTGMTRCSRARSRRRERVAKRIARSGLCSRRDAERWIAAGRVAVDGALLTSPAVTVTAANLVTVDGQPLPPRRNAPDCSATTSPRVC